MSVGNGKGMLRRAVSVAAGITSLMVLGAMTAQVSVAQIADTDVHVPYGDLDLSTAAGCREVIRPTRVCGAKGVSPGGRRRVVTVRGIAAMRGEAGGRGG